MKLTFLLLTGIRKTGKSTKPVVIDNPKLAGFLNPKPMKVTIYTTVDQWS